MQRIVIAFLVGIVVIFIADFQKSAAQDDKCDCRFVGESLEEISKIKSKMTRKDLLEIFETEGGISTRTFNHYVYKKCAYIKVDVEFKAVEDEQNDEIIKISKPFLEYAIAD